MTRQYRYNKVWRQRHPKKRQADKMRYYRKHRYYPQRREQRKVWWSPSEIELITAPNRPPDRILAKQLSRSVQAIQVKRSKLRVAA